MINAADEAPSFEDRVRAGDRSTIDEAQAAYQANPDRGTLFRLLNVLYTFRRDAGRTEEMCGYAPQLIEAGIAMLPDLSCARRDPRVSSLVAEAEVVASWALFISRVKHSSVRKDLQHLILRLYRGTEHLFIFVDRETRHAVYLLILTYAELQLDHGKQDNAINLLTYVMAYGPVGDAYQAMRINRRLRVVYGRTRIWYQGLIPGIQAVRAAFQVSRFEVLKSLAAFAPRRLRLLAGVDI